jgi:ABC-2 type transport system ATP-binding protein
VVRKASKNRVLKLCVFNGHSSGLTPVNNIYFVDLGKRVSTGMMTCRSLVGADSINEIEVRTCSSRRAIWDLVRGIRDRGKTVFLTTHLMEEAERLCDRVTIMEHGRIIDIDTPERLVATHCPERTIVLDTDDSTAAERFRKIPGVESVTCIDKRFTICGRGDDLVTEVIHCLSEPTSNSDHHSPSVAFFARGFRFSRRF